MQITPRAVIYATLAVGPLLLAAGCGGATATGPSATLVKIQPTSFVEVAPATTTTTTTIAAIDLGAGVSPVEQIYTVKAGDGASKIASLHDITMEQLVNYNEWPEGISHQFFVGDLVKIPPGAKIPGTGGDTAAGDSGDSGGDSTTDDATASGDCPTTYVIKVGDTVRSRIADDFGITFQEMDAANASTPGYQNFISGIEIIIPCPS